MKIDNVQLKRQWTLNKDNRQWIKTTDMERKFTLKRDKCKKNEENKQYTIHMDNGHWIKAKYSEQRQLTMNKRQWTMNKKHGLWTKDNGQCIKDNGQWTK